MQRQPVSGLETRGRDGGVRYLTLSQVRHVLLTLDHPSGPQRQRQCCAPCQLTHLAQGFRIHGLLGQLSGPISQLRK